MTLHLALQRMLLPSAQVSSLTTGSITLPSARGAFVPQTAYQSIASVLVGTATSTISFTSIPQTFKHLEIRAMHFLTANGNNWDGTGYWAFNSDTTASNYRYNGFYGYNTSAPAATASTASRAVTVRTGGNENGTTYPAASFIRLLDYSSTNKYKSALVHNGVDNTGTGAYAFVLASTWTNTAAVTQIDFTPSAGETWGVGTQFALYGILGE